MKNKLITTIKFEKPRKTKLSFDDKQLIISDVKFSYHHDQQCCEKVYADFPSIKYYKKQIEEIEEITKIEIKRVEDTGFIIFLYFGYDERLGILINCYNEQNGYYGDDLNLIIADGDNKIGEFAIDKFDKIE